MQIRISWTVLGALLIFVVAVVILGRFLFSLVGPEAAATLPPTAMLATATSPIAGTPSATAPTLQPTRPSSAETPTRAAGEPAAATTALVPTATATSAASAPTPSATSAPSATPAPSLTPAPSATPAPATLEVVSQGFGQVEERLGYAFIVGNPNPDLIARDAPYQVIVYDETGIILRTDMGSIPLVAAGSQASTAQILTLPGGLSAARIEVVLGSPQYVRAIPQPDLSFANIAFLPGDPARITGLIRNPLATPLQSLPVVGIAFDGQGRIIGGGTGEVPFVPAGGQAAAEVPLVVSGDVASVALYARPAELLAP